MNIEIPLSAFIEPEGFGEHDFFAEIDNEIWNDEQEEEEYVRRY